MLQQIITNIKNTLHGFKKLHGRSFDDPYIKAERSKLPYELHRMPNGSVGVKVSSASATVVSIVYLLGYAK